MVKPWRLTRHYSLVSLIGTALVAVALVVFYRQMATSSLMQREEQANQDIAQTLINGLWPHYIGILKHADTLTPEQLRQRTETIQLRHDILRKIQGLRVVKVKIYDPKGHVVFSTQESQIGTNRADDGGVQLALSGLTETEITYRNQFSAHEKKTFDQSLVTSYVPIRRAFDEPIEGVLEIYSDVTAMVADINKSGYEIVGVVVGLLLLLYLFLIGIVHRADVLVARYNEDKDVRQKKRLDYIENHDELTGLYNRTGIQKAVNEALERSAEGAASMGVMKLKLRGFSEINQNLGHLLGDKLLRLAAERIRFSVPAGDAAGRSDGSEFVIVLENLYSEQEVHFLAMKLHSMFADPFHVENTEVAISLVIGVCLADGKSATAEQLLNNAATALSVARMTPNRRYVLFEEQLEIETQQRFELEQEINRAIANWEFTLYYQPRVEAGNGKIVVMEALMRWKHPERGLVTAAQFLDRLEESEKLIRLTPWLLEQACCQGKAWHDDGYADLRVAVNISVKQLHAENFVEMVSEALERSGLDARFLELELTESVLAKDKVATGERLRQLKAMGITLSLDDFGTGYSSLSYLMHFPFDYLKIDRSFIRDIFNNRDHASLTTAIIAMAKTLNLGIVAEGVETADQLAFVRGMECDEIQGYYISEAIAPESFGHVLTIMHKIPNPESGRVTH